MLRKYFYPLVLFILAIAVFITNYKPGTFLIGWDNIMPEFNFWINLKRNLLGIWLSYRGLGLYDGQAQVANLTHTLFTGVLSLLLPTSMIRYVVIIFLHFLGGLGAYIFIKTITKNKHSSFIAALFYMFNLGTIQQFFTPFEAFAFQFAALPWLLYLGYCYLQKKNKKNLIIFFLASFLFTPQFFVPTLFISFMMFLSILVIFDLIFNKTIKNFLIILIATLIVNSFWLLPYVVGLKNNAQVIQKSRINQYSSEEIYLRNKTRGDLSSVFSLKGFMMDNDEFDSVQGKNFKLMDKWINYTNGNSYFIAYVFILVFGLIGIYKAKNKKELIPFYIPLIISVFFLANNTPLIKEINDFIRNLLPIFSEVLRLPFTKFIIPFILSLSIFIAIGLTTLYKKRKYFRLIFFISLTCIFITTWPVFQGYLFSYTLKRVIPKDYFEVFDFFSKQDKSKRIALLPANTFWQWYYRKWGQGGTDFLWFGIPQPIMMRAFDPWSQYNEQFYNEINYAFKTNDKKLLNQVINKYQISYLLLDTYISTGPNYSSINYEKIIDFLDKNSVIKNKRNFGQLVIYEINSNKDGQITNAVNISQQTSFYYEDKAYEKYGDYVINIKNPDIIIPFPSFFSEKTGDDVEVMTEEKQNSIILSPKNSPFENLSEENSFTLVLPSLLREYLIPTKIQLIGKTIRFDVVYPKILIDGITYQYPDQTLVIQTNINPKTIKLTESDQVLENNKIAYLINGFPNTIKISDGINTQFKTIDLNSLSNDNYLQTINIKSTSSIKVEIPKVSSKFSLENIITNDLYEISQAKSIKLSSDGLSLDSDSTNTELITWNNYFPHQSGYISFSQIKWKSGLPLTFYIDNHFEKRAEIESKLSKNNINNVFFIPPGDNYYSGYGVHYIAKTIGNQFSSTLIKNFSLYPFPYNLISDIELKKNNITNNNIITNNESYNPGWIAFANGKILPHVKVNNWANGWILDDVNSNLGSKINNPKSITIIFWPQYLEFVGFALLVIAFLRILLIKDKNE